MTDETDIKKNRLNIYPVYDHLNQPDWYLSHSLTLSCDTVTTKQGTTCPVLSEPISHRTF